MELNKETLKQNDLLIDLLVDNLVIDNESVRIDNIVGIKKQISNIDTMNKIYEGSKELNERIYIRKNEILLYLLNKAKELNYDLSTYDFPVPKHSYYALNLSNAENIIEEQLLLANTNEDKIEIIKDYYNGILEQQISSYSNIVNRKLDDIIPPSESQKRINEIIDEMHNNKVDIKDFNNADEYVKKLQESADKDNRLFNQILDEMGNEYQKLEKEYETMPKVETTVEPKNETHDLNIDKTIADIDEKLAELDKENKSMNNNVKETNIIIKLRNYNGDYGMGSVYTEEFKLNVKQPLNNVNNENGLVIFTDKTGFCCDERLGFDPIATIKTEIPFIVTSDKLNIFNRMVEEIKTDSNYKYNESHYSNDKFDPKRFEYFDIIIDNESFESNNDKVFKVFLCELVDVEKITESMDDYYEKLSTILRKMKQPLVDESIIQEQNNTEFDRISQIVNDVAGTEDIDEKNLLCKLAKKVIDLPFDTETTIAKLMQLDQVMVDPLTQGKVFNLLNSVCEKLNIKIEVNHDEFGGLGYHYKFKKINSKSNLERFNEMFEVNENGRFKKLIIPVHEPSNQYENELNLIDKILSECTIEESTRAKLYSDKLFYQLPNEDRIKANRLLMTQEEFKYLFESDESGAFIRLVIPAYAVESGEKEMDLRGKKPTDFTQDEVITMKKYAYECSQQYLEKR